MITIVHLYDEKTDKYCARGHFCNKLIEKGNIYTMSTVEQIKAAYEAFVEENQKFVEKGNKAAGGRARKALMELAKLAKVRRAEILEERK